jgi:outer membrane protein X
VRSLCLSLLAIAAGSTDALAEAKHYENVRVDAGLTGSTVSISGRNGTGMAVEIKGMAHDNIAIGGRVEMAVMFGGVVGEDEAPLDVSMAASGLLKAEYLFGRSTVRPFLGLGAGGYTIGSQTIDPGPNRDGIRSSTGRYFGVAPQVGVDIGPVRVAATYNAILGAYLELHQTVGSVEETSRLSQNYLSLEVSFQFAGGRKQPAATLSPAGSPGAH